MTQQRPPSAPLLSPSLHNLLMPHDNRYWPWDERSCPPNCSYRLWVETHRPQAPSDHDHRG